MFVLLYLYYAFEFDSYIERCDKFHSFIILIPYLSFAEAIFWGHFQRVCSGPLHFNIQPCTRVKNSVHLQFCNLHNLFQCLSVTALLNSLNTNKTLKHVATFVKLYY